MYLHATINRHRLAPADPHATRTLHQLRSSLLAPGRWPLAPFLQSISLSGSLAKHTALRASGPATGASDLDILLSLHPAAPAPLSAWLPSLAEHFRDRLPLPRNVSLRITLDGRHIDLVPARRRPGSTRHTLWQSRFNTWLQTDIAEQIRYVRSSGLTTEILALKLWSRRNLLRFPSFLQELAVIRAIPPGRPISESFLRLLEYLATSFPHARLTDPANSNNVVSDLLTLDEKLRIAYAAERSLQAREWSEVLP
jgi:hypothetical protein